MKNIKNLIGLHCSALEVHFITFERFWLLEKLHLLLFFSFPFFRIIQIVFGKKFLFEMWKLPSVVGVLPFSPCRSSLFVEQSPMNGEYRRKNEELPSSKIHLVALEIIVCRQFYNCIVCIFILTWVFLVKPYPTNLSSYRGAESSET